MKLLITVELTKTLVKKELAAASPEEATKKVKAICKDGIMVRINKSDKQELTYFPPSRIHEIRLKETL